MVQGSASLPIGTIGLPRVIVRMCGGYVIEKRGSSGKQIALTFDDGPDERNTGKLLDALKELHVPAFPDLHP